MLQKSLSKSNHFAIGFSSHLIGAPLVFANDFSPITGLVTAKAIREWPGLIRYEGTRRRDQLTKVEEWFHRVPFLHIRLTTSVSSAARAPFATCQTSRPRQEGALRGRKRVASCVLVRRPAVMRCCKPSSMFVTASSFGVRF